MEPKAWQQAPLLGATDQNDQAPAAPDATAPDATAPDATAPDATAPDATAPDATAPDATAPDAAAPSRASRLPTLRLPNGLQPKLPWAMLGAAATVILVVAGLARIVTVMSARPTPKSAATAMPSPTITPTPLPAHPLTWQPGTAPIRLVREADPPVSAFAPAPVDGRVAYLCGAQWTNTNADIQPQVWVTTDRAAHWSLIKTIPLRRHYNSCRMVADDTNAASAMVTMTYNGATPDAGAVATFFTGNAGRNWNSVGANGAGYISQLASMGTATYMLYNTGNQPPQLFVAPFSSLADTHVWQRLDAGLPAPVQRFWLNPSSGALLVALDSSSTQSRLYQSNDLGKTWSAIQAPRFDFIEVQQPSGASPWHICAMAVAGSGQEAISCTVDGGRSWTNRPALTIPPATACAQCGVAVRALGPAMVAESLHIGLARDGSLLQIGNMTQNATNGPLQYTIFRLAPDASQWQSLGPIPEVTIAYSATPNGGVLWALPAVGIPIDAQQRPFTADYPS